MKDPNYKELPPAEFPEVGGVRVFVPRPAAALQAFLIDLGAIEARFAADSADLERARPELPASMRRRADRLLAGMVHDMSVMEAAVAPIREAVNAEHTADDFIAWASIQTGLSLHDMFIYFYQDWAPAAEFERVKRWFYDAVEQHCPRRASVAVLGAGACGLAHALANQFRQTYAVDLSLPTLLLAKSFIGGQPLAVHLKQANWERAELNPPPAPPNPIQFLAANVTNLPYRDGSLSCVVTQCLFDIVDNPVHLAEEIYRVLEPQGVWINFSHAFDAPGDPIQLSPRKLEEVPLVLGPVGFDVLSLERKRFVMLDPSGIDAEAARTDDDVHLFAMSKASGRAPVARFRGLRERFQSGDPSLWRTRPKTIPGKEISLSSTASFGEGAQRRTELRVGPYTMPIPAEYAELLGAMLQHVDGRKSLSEIYESLGAEATIARPEFLELVFCLSVERYLLDLRE